MLVAMNITMPFGRIMRVYLGLQGTMDGGLTCPLMLDATRNVCHLENNVSLTLYPIGG